MLLHCAMSLIPPQRTTFNFPISESDEATSINFFHYRLFKNAKIMVGFGTALR